MAIKVSRSVKAIRRKPVGEILWLAVTVVEFAIIMGIVCLPPRELPRRVATGATSGNRSVSVVPALVLSPTLRLLTYSVNPLPPDGRWRAKLAVRGSSGGVDNRARGQAASSGATVTRDIGRPALAAAGCNRPGGPCDMKEGALLSWPASTLTPPTVADLQQTAPAFPPHQPKHSFAHADLRVRSATGGSAQPGPCGASSHSSAATNSPGKTHGEGCLSRVDRAGVAVAGHASNHTRKEN